MSLQYMYLVAEEREEQDIVYGQTDGRTTDERVSHKLDRSLTSRANKIVNNIDKADKDILFPQNVSNTCSQRFKIYKRHCRANIRKFSFSRVVDLWNSLPPDLVEAVRQQFYKQSLERLPTKIASDCYRSDPETARKTTKWTVDTA